MRVCTLLQALDGDLAGLYSDKALPLKVDDVLLLQLLHLDQLLLESQLFAAQLLLLKRKSRDMFFFFLKTITRS